MPGNRRRTLSLTGVLVSVQSVALLLATRAAAAPSDEPCDLIRGPAKEYCEGDGGSTLKDGGGPGDIPSALDPLSALAKGCGEAAAYVIDALSKLVNETTRVDFTNDTFLQQYAVVFAASTILTLVLWLLAVAKRAVRGVPFTEALTEAVGFLWLVVLASAFTPLILYTVVSATDAVTEAVATGTEGDTNAFFGTFSQALEKGEGIGGGPIMLIIVSLISVLAAGVLYLELVIRAALLYVGALLGTAVYAGLVDKNLWGHVRRWAGIMIAVILVKPVIMIVLGLAGALASEEGPNSFSAIVSGLAIILLAIFASAMIYRFVPGFGDEIVAQRGASADAASSKAVAAVSSPAHMLRQGINTHGARGNGGGGGAGGGGGPGGGGGGRDEGSRSRQPNQAAGGMAAHGARQGNSGAAAPPREAAPAPAPRRAEDSAGDRGARGRTPHSNRSTGGDRG